MKRVTVPITATMPHMCCECGVAEGLHLHTMKQSDGRTRWKGKMPFCGVCAKRGLMRFVGGAALMWILAAAGTLIFFLHSVDRFASGPLVTASVIATFFTIVVWPRVRRRAVKLLVIDRHNQLAVFGCANPTFAAALADQNPVARAVEVPSARIT